MDDSIRIAKALSDPIRFRILQLLANGRFECCRLPLKGDSPEGLCNCVLMEELGLIQSRVSYHMKELVEAALVIEEPLGRWKFYRINRQTLRRYLEKLQQEFLLHRE
ncbi:MAG: metalloregulator ArsR/SmtB family transcription factor [Syntrophomonadaceae bacterium]|nr:metalloregulator ArsR/SmtB family transcription factor [Syntrophomonadaceae bacterium]